MAATTSTTPPEHEGEVAPAAQVRPVAPSPANSTMASRRAERLRREAAGDTGAARRRATQRVEADGAAVTVTRVGS